MTAYQNYQASKLTQANVQAIATASQGLFGNLQETGWNDWFNQQLQAAESEFVTSYVNPYVASQVQALASAGIKLTSQQIQSLCQAAANEIQQIVSQLINSGIASIESNITTQFSSAVNGVQQQAKAQSGNPASLQLLPAPEGSFFNCGNLGLIADGIALGAYALDAGLVSGGFTLIGFALGALHEAAFC